MTKTIILLLLLFLSVSANSQSKKYYRNVYQTIFGEYVGVYPIDSIQAHKTTHYVFSFDDEKKLVSIENFEAISGYYLYSSILSSPMLEFEYKDDSKFIYNRIFDWNNETIRSSTFYEVQYSQNRVSRIITKTSDLEDEYFEESSLDFIYNEQNQLNQLNMVGQSPFNFAYQSLSAVEVELNKNNQIVMQIIQENVSDPEYNIEYSKTQFSYDDNGNFLTLKTYNKDGSLKNSGYNVAYTVYSYDKNGYEIGKIMYGFENERVDYISTEYIAETDETQTYLTTCEVRSTYDENGNLISTKSFDKNKDAYEDEYGIHETIWESDLNSGIYTEYYFNSKHQKVNGVFGFAGKEIHKDGRGSITYEKYIDAEGNLIPEDYGVYIVKRDYDYENASFMESYFDFDNKPMTDNSGAFQYEKLIDAESSIYERAFGIDGEFLGEDDVYDMRIRNLYDEDNGLLISTSHFDLNREPMMSDQNFFQELNTYSSESYLVSTEYFDTELNPVNAYFGDLSYSKIEYKHDELGNETEKAYFDMEGNRAFDENMISVYKTMYNSNGSIIQVDRFSAEMELLNPTISFATVKYQYDLNNLVSEEAYYNNKGQLWQDLNGIARYTFVNENDHIVKKAFFNSQNKATCEPQGVYQIATSYFVGGNINEIKFLNKKGKKMNNLEGCHRIKYSYNESGNPSKIELFNKKGKPVMADPALEGVKFAYIEFVYDEEGFLIELKYFNDRGILVYTQTS